MSLIKDSLIETLIEEIEKRPALYNPNLKEYSDGNLKKYLWEEVCETVLPEWNQLDSKERRIQVQETQKRWTNFRTCFRRELKSQSITLGQDAPKRRRQYMYFDKLSFLLPCLENWPSECKQSTASDEEDEEHNIADGESFPHNAYKASSTSTFISQRKSHNESKAAPTTMEVNEELLKVLRGPKDEDTNFALSIVPSLQALTADEKLDAKIGILNIFRDIRKARRRRF